MAPEPFTRDPFQKPVQSGASTGACRGEFRRRKPAGSEELRITPHQTKMTERTPWWKAFLPKKKSGSTKESNHVFGPDFDPFAQHPKQKEPNVSSKSSGSQSHSQQESNNSSLISDETYDDSQLNSVFNEKTCRRNMTVSRSGRFKMKGRGRSTLQIE